MLSINFQAVTIESSGVIGRDTDAFIGRLSYLTASTSGERRDAELFRQGLSLATVHGNARSVTHAGRSSSRIWVSLIIIVIIMVIPKCYFFIEKSKSGKIRSGAPNAGLILNSDLSPAAPQGGREPLTEKTRVVSTRRRVPTNLFSGRTLQPSIESVVANSFVPSDFLVDGQVSGLGLCTPFSL